MSKKLLRPLALAATLILSLAPVSADDKKKEEKKEPKEELYETQHKVAIDGKELEYTATAGTILLKEEDGKARASFFFVSYTKNSAQDMAARPITFSFNGGPGSSSVWLHLGALGPRRVHLNEDGTMPPPPFKLVDNEYSILNQTDLVFIDPISTGFSRAVPGEDPHKFHGLDEDISSVGEFIRLYITRYKRWGSPKFLIGESYGTTRAAGLSDHLQERYGMYLNGIMLVSVVLDFQTISFTSGNELPYSLFLPSFAATAWYHKKLAPDLQADLQKTLTQAENFALGEYSAALLKGASLTDAERAGVAEKVARFTGLSKDFVDRANLRVTIYQFTKELLRDKRLTAGRFDSRMTGRDKNAVGESFDYDPSYASVLGVFAGSMNNYVRSELKFETELPYETLTGKVSPWNYGGFNNRYVTVADSLRQAMTHNPYLRVFAANGFYDLATPYLATEFTVNHLGLDPSLQKNVSLGFYEGGHMMYTHKPSLIKLKKDLDKFIQDSLPKP